MKSWLISDGGDPWKVELDVTDLGGHLDTTLRGRAGTLTDRIKSEVLKVAAVGPSALHGIEAFPISNSGLGLHLSLLRGPLRHPLRPLVQYCYHLTG